jgi:hypothetical protein
MRERSAGRAGLICVLAGIATILATVLPSAPARANDIPLNLSTQQTFNGKTYGFCFSGISAKAGSNPQKTLTASCTGTFTTSTSIPSDNPLLITFFGPITVTCPNGKVAATKLGSTGALYSLFLVTGMGQNSSSIQYDSPCGDKNVFSLGVSAWFPMAAWVIYISP